MDVRNNKYRNGLTHAWVTFNQSEMSLPRGGRAERAGKILVAAGSGSGGEWEINRKDPWENIYISRPAC